MRKKCTYFLSFKLNSQHNNDTRKIISLSKNSKFGQITYYCFGNTFR